MANETKSSTLDQPYRSDLPKTGDRDTYAESRSQYAAATRELGEKAGDVIDRAADKAHEVSESVKHAGENIAGKARDTHGAICDFTKSNPTTALLLAIGIGAILARILPRN